MKGSVILIVLISMMIINVKNSYPKLKKNSGTINTIKHYESFELCYINTINVTNPVAVELFDSTNSFVPIMVLVSKDSINTFDCKLKHDFNKFISSKGFVVLQASIFKELLSDYFYHCKQVNNEKFVKSLIKRIYKYDMFSYFGYYPKSYSFKGLTCYTITQQKYMMFLISGKLLVHATTVHGSTYFKSTPNIYYKVLVPKYW
ncbi:MAG: hypothetical protein U0Y96_09715 [Candidatus Kapaibacterium sp.]